MLGSIGNRSHSPSSCAIVRAACSASASSRVAAERGQSERAERLWAAIESEDPGAPLGGWRRHRQRCEERIREAAGPDFERGYAEGRTLTLDDAVSLVLVLSEGER